MIDTQNGHKKAWKEHCDRWSVCTDCDLHQRTSSHVLLRGHIPCDYLFIGEAPGETEDILGYPFVGRSGKKLDDIITRVQKMLGATTFVFGATNTVACTPWTEKKESLQPPSAKQITACSDRLRDLLLFTKPKAVIYVGSVAEKAYKGTAMFADVTELSIVHPAYILRQRQEQAEIHEKRSVLRIVNMVRDLQ